MTRQRTMWVALGAAVLGAVTLGVRPEHRARVLRLMDAHGPMMGGAPR